LRLDSTLSLNQITKWLRGIPGVTVRRRSRGAIGRLTVADVRRAARGLGCRPGAAPPRRADHRRLCLCWEGTAQATEGEAQHLIPETDATICFMHYGRARSGHWRRATIQSTITGPKMGMMRNSSHHADRRVRRRMRNAGMPLMRYQNASGRNWIGSAFTGSPHDLYKTAR
jgi:hypothetical protein